MQNTYACLPPQVNYNEVENNITVIVRPLEEFNLCCSNNKNNIYFINGNNINITYSLDGICSDLDEYIELTDGFINMVDDDANYFYNEFLKYIILDNDDEEQIVSNDFIYNIYIKDKHLFDDVLNKIILSDDVKLCSDVLRSLIFADINFNNDKIIALMQKCINSSENYAISRVITILEILSDNEIINNFINVEIKSKSLSKRFKKLL